MLLTTATSAVVVAAVASAPTGRAAFPAQNEVGATQPASASYQLSTADRRIARMLSARTSTAAVSAGFSGAVLDVSSNRLVWSKRGTVGRMPASTAKLVTATTALTVFGPEHRFTTRVRQGATRSRVMLVGGGDPSLSTADLRQLARSTASSLRRSGLRRVTVWADDSLFPTPTPAPGWRSSYVPSEVRWVRALVVDERHAANTSTDAAHAFARQLEAAGIDVVGRKVGVTPRGGRLLASVQGDRLSAIVARMLLRSDNDHAEALHRLVAVARGWPTSWIGAGRAQRSVLRRDGIDLPVSALADGSGLSRASRVSAVQLAAVVDNVLEPGQPELAPMRSGALPLAGRTGTLQAGYGRFASGPARCAAGRVTAKTGTLRDVIALAGWTRARDGRVKAFAFVVNGPAASLARKQRLDLLAATVTGCA
ncbi:MAG: D-alanyl-D-alanine carboxypeptidase/D-alanyl-D-alanine endopeptidase [Angustibacter sp.]